MSVSRTLVVELVLVLGSAALLIAPADARGDTIYACVAKSTGTARIVSATTICDSRKETSLNWNATGPQGPQGPPGSGPLRYADANSQLVGYHYAQGLTVRFIGGATGDPVSFPVNVGGVFANGLYYFYESTDCSGTGYALADPSNVVRTGFVLTSSATLRYAPRTGTVRDLRSQVALTPEGVSTGCFAFDGALTRAAGPFVEVVLPTFVPPVRLTQ